MALKLRCGSCSLQGARSSNEDAVAVAGYCDFICFLVADGMGGPDIGALASRCAVTIIPEQLSKPARDRAGCSSINSALRHAFAQAHASIQQLRHGNLRAGSTIVLALWIRGTELLCLAHVGNSRAYRVRGGAIERLTLDHDVREALIAAGRFTREQMSSQSVRNVLLRCLGAEGESTPDLRPEPIQAGDRFLLATDGLTKVVSEKQLSAFIREKADVQECADGLGQLALDQGSRDNVSCIVIEVVGGKG